MRTTLFVFVLILFTYPFGTTQYGLVRWQEFPPERIEALTLVTRPGTSIGFLEDVSESRYECLWNGSQSNVVVMLTNSWEWVGTGEYYSGIETGEHVFLIPPSIDYLYLSPDRYMDRAAIDWLREYPWIAVPIYEDEWGAFYEVQSDENKEWPEMPEGYAP